MPLERWREFATVLLGPIPWLIGLQRVLIDFFTDSSSGWTATTKYALLACPTLLALVAVWCTQLSLYTLLFRSQRIHFLSTLLVAWWDALYAAWMYWVGMIRAATVLFGWIVTLLSLATKLVFEAARQLVVLPAAATGRMTDRYFRPGIAWIALILLAFWCALEATVFTYTLLPTVSEAAADAIGADQLPRGTAAVLWFFLFVLIMGSFVCIQLLIEAVKHRNVTVIVPIVLIELFVMFFEVMFLYGELAHAITPWIVQETGGQFRPGIWFTLSVARFGWIAIRGLTWFLFGQYGTPPLLAVIARQPVTSADTLSGTPAADKPASWRALRDELARERWFPDKGEQLLDYVALPVLHLVATALNFVMVLMTAQPLVSMPFKGVKEGCRVFAPTEYRRRVRDRHGATRREISCP